MTEDEAPERREWPGPLRDARVRRWLIGCAIAYAVYAIALGLVAPRVARGPIEESVGELLGVRVAIERISVNPFILRFEVSGIELRHESGDLLVSADALVVDLELAKSLLGVVRVGEIVLDTPEVHGEISSEGELNLLALIPETVETAEPAESPQEGEASDTLFPVRVDEIRLIAGAIRFVDRSQPHLFVASMEPIDLDIRDLSTLRDEQGRVRLEATGSRGVHFVTEFVAGLEPLFAKGDVAVEGIGYDIIADYLGPDFVVRPTAGQIEVHTDFELALDDESGPVVRVNDGGVEARGWEVESDLGDLRSLGLDRFSIQGFRLGLVERAIHVDEILLEGPRVAVALRDGAGDSADAQDDGSPDDAPNAADTPDQAPAPDAAEGGSVPGASEWQVEVSRFAIDRGLARIESPVTDGESLVSIGPIDFEASEFTTAPDEATRLSLAVALPDAAHSEDRAERTSSQGPRLSVEGQVVSRPFSAELEVKAVDVALAPFSPLAGFAPGSRISSGRLDATSSVRAKLADGGESPSVSARTQASVEDLVIEQAREGQREAEPVLRIGRLAVDELQVDETGERVRLKIVDIDSPKLFAERNARGELNLSKLMAPAPASGTEPGPGGSGPGGPSVDVRRVEISDGQLDYRDATPNRPFSLALTDISGAFDRRTGSDAATGGAIDFTARAGGATPVTLKGSFPSGGEIDLSLDVEGLAVTTLAPYFEQYVGSEVEQGKLHLDLDYEIDGHKVYGRNDVRFDRLAFGRRTGSKDALKLPVPLAFRLMTDTQGQAQFDFAIAGDLDDPDFDLRRLITTAFVKVIQQALSSPLAVLQTAMPDLTADKRTQVDFAVGSAVLDGAQIEKLVAVATILANDTDHRVAIRGRVAPRPDRKALVKADEEAADEERLHELARSRAQAVRAELVDRHGLDPDRVFIRSADLEGKAPGDRVPVDVVLTDD